MAEKTEKATPKKLRDARKKGQVAKSKDFPAAFTFVTSFALLIYSSRSLFEQLSGFMLSVFSNIQQGERLTSQLMASVNQAIYVIMNASLPFMLCICLVGVLVNFLIIGPLFSLESMKPDIKKLNPITNLKGMFKIKTFIELLKSIMKILGACILIYSVIYTSLPEIIATASLPIIGTTMVFSEFLIKVAIRVGIFFLAIAIFDLAFQKKNFAKEMKMEKFDIKQEYKDSEGNPEIKGKRRQNQQELAYQDSPQVAKNARAIITNPIHIAVALTYDLDIDPAPKILIMGKGETAASITKVALANNIPIMRNVPLAQMLYNNGSIGQYIPEDTYEAIAEVLKWLESLEATDTIEYNIDLFK